jgi:glucose-1-phosphate thymidylyltransferase
MKVIIPMAGRGTRVRPHSHVTPKPLMNVKGKSMVERIIDTLTASIPGGIDEGVFILGPDFGVNVRQQLTQICDRHGMKTHFAIQEKAEGTAHAVFCAEEHLDGEGIVVFADTLFEMESAVDLSGADVIVWVKYVEDPSRFGVAVRQGDRVVEFVEKPKELISNEALIGIYYIRDLRQFRDYIARLIEQNRRGPSNEFFLTDAFDDMLKQGLVFKTASVSEWLDCGTIEALLDTTKIILDKEQDGLRQGTVENAIIHDPVYIGPGATVKDSVVGPYVSIEAGAEVRESVLRDSIVFSKARVQRAVLQDSLIGQNATVNGQRQRLNVGDHSEIG